MKLLMTLLIITSLVGCGREERLSPYEYVSYIDAEAQLVLKKIRLMDRDESLSKKEKCKQAYEETNRFSRDIMETLNLKSLQTTHLPLTPEGIARRDAIKKFLKYKDVFREFLFSAGCNQYLF
jgi:hypothetical protein